MGERVTAFAALPIVIQEPASDPSTPYQVRRWPDIHDDELRRWDCLIGSELLWCMDHKPACLSYQYEDEDHEYAQAASALEYGIAALQILSTVGALAPRTICTFEDNRYIPRAVARSQELKTTAWNMRLLHASDSHEIDFVANRLRLAFDRGVQRLTIPSTLFVHGLSSQNPDMRVLLWAAGIDSIVMAGSKREFCIRLSKIFGEEHRILPLDANNCQPTCSIGEIVDDIYQMRSEIAHGRRVSARFERTSGLACTNGASAIVNYKWRQVIEECTLFILQRLLRCITTTDLYMQVNDDGRWRRLLKTPHSMGCGA